MKIQTFALGLVGLGMMGSAFAQGPRTLESPGSANVIGSFTDAPEIKIARNADHQLSMNLKGDEFRAMGVVSTQGMSDFHIIFKPGTGYSIYAPGKVKGFYDESKVPFEKGVFFHGASFPGDSPVNLDLTSPGSVVAFDKSYSGGKVGFKVLEFELAPSIADYEHRFLRLVVTESADVVPLSMSATSMRSLLPSDVKLDGPNAFNAEEFLRKNLYKVSNVKASGAFTFEQLGNHSAKIGVTSEQLTLRESESFDVKNPWATLEETYQKKVTKWSMFSNMFSKKSKIPSLFEMQLHEADPLAFKAMKELQEQKPFDSSALKVVKNISDQAPEVEFTDFSKNLGAELEFVQNKTALSPSDIISETVRFPFSAKKQSELSYFFSVNGKKAYFVDLDEVATKVQKDAGKSGVEMFEDVLKLRESRQAFFLVTLSHGTAEVSYLNPGSQQSVASLLRRDMPNECQIALHGVVANGMMPGFGGAN